MNDNEIIQKTRIEPNLEKGYVSMIIDMPTGEPFVQRAQDAESAKKHIMAWCEAVRGELKAREERRTSEQAAAKARRKTGIDEDQLMHTDDSGKDTVVTANSKGQILEYFDGLQEQIDSLSNEIANLTDKRNELRDERDQLAPVMAIWRGSE